MRGIYKNYITSIAATNENLNYSVANVYHKYLEKYFLATLDTSLLTVTFTDVVDLDSVIIGYHNLSAATLRLYNASAVLIGTIVLDVDEDATYFTSVADVKTATLEITTSMTYARLGGFWLSEYLQFPNPLTSIPNPLFITSSAEKGVAGQLNGLKNNVLDQNNFSFPPIIDLDTIDLLNEFISYVQTSEPFWIDKYEEAHDIRLPIYCSMIGTGGFPKIERQNRGFSFNIEECK